MNKYKKNKKEIIFNIIVLVIFVCGTGYIALHHESWGDEAQSWLISRDLSIVDIFKEMKYESHSMLWNLVLLPFIKLGLPYEYMNLISCFIVDISVYIILFKIRTSKLLKLLIIFSEPYVFFYSVIARCYCLIPLFISILIVLEQNLKKNMYIHAFILLILVNVHAVMIPVAIIIAIYRYFPVIKESIKTKDKQLKKKCVICILFVFIGVCLFIIQIIDLKSSVVFDKVSAKRDLNYITQQLTFSIRNICFFWIPKEISTVIFILLAISVLIVSKYYSKQSILLFISTFIILVSNCIVNLCSNVQRSQIIIFILFYIAMDIYSNIEKYKGVPKCINILAIVIYVIVCIGSATDAIPTVKNEITGNYSSAKETMEYINANYQDEERICYFVSLFRGTALVPYAKSDCTFYDLINDRECTYYHWNMRISQYMNIYMDKIVDRIKIQMQEKDKIVLIVSTDMDYLVSFLDMYFIKELKFKSSKIFHTKNNVEEEYIVYEISNVDRLQ